MVTEPARRAPNPNQLTRTVPYTSQQRLELLAQGIQNAVIGADALECEIVEFASRNHRTAGPISFHPDERERRVPAHAVSREHVDARRSPVSDLKSLLNELLDAIHAD
jgi:hypothetical protein